MVRAILNGTKTQTRRAVKPQFAADAKPAEMGATNERGHQISGHSGLWWDDCTGDADAAVRCPYGQPGDRLWVRESMLFDPDQGWRYSADGADVVDENYGKSDQRCPSIHMPRSCCRILLEITGVRVEQLQAINEADAKAEGVKHSLHLPGGRFARENFAHLWWTINGDGSWEANPWVWVIEFKRLEGGAIQTMSR